MIDQPISTIGSYGVLGALCVILMIVTYRLFTLLLAEKDGRRSDAEKVREAVLEPLKEMRRSLDLIFDKVNDDK